MHEKQIYLKELSEKEMIEKRKKQEEIELQECSFHPKLKGVKRGIYTPSESISPIRYFQKFMILF